MTKIYVGDVGTEISIDVGADISTATVRKINAVKPDGKKVSWTAVADAATSMKYVTGPGDIDQQGDWKLQCYIDMPGWKGSSDPVLLTVGATL